jgi:hypothetical protein
VVVAVEQREAEDQPLVVQEAEQDIARTLALLELLTKVTLVVMQSAVHAAVAVVQAVLALALLVQVLMVVTVEQVFFQPLMGPPTTTQVVAVVQVGHQH